MRNKKNFFVVFISFVLCATAFCGCSFSSSDENGHSRVKIQKIKNISEDFICGMDTSAVLALENSGVVYHGFDGKEQDVFQTLSEAGVNYIRLRIWNDPYDENGNGYGGGNNDLQTAITLGKRATLANMKVFIDFHYSDFWADPKRQHAPKAWSDMDIEEKSVALSEFTKESLKALLDAGVDVGMVQVGNETNYGIAGEYFSPRMMTLFSAGCDAVRTVAREYDRDIKVALHFTNIDNLSEISSMASSLSKAKIDYDIFAFSYYPFWNGSIDSMQKSATLIQEQYGKQVLIAETSYCYTSEDGDGTGNSFHGTDDLVENYPASVQGQADMIRDICAAANEVGAMGVFYWEGTWLPVGREYSKNSILWEKYGSGWASSYASDYDPEDAGKYYGGCSWENQAMFDFDGYPLESLRVFSAIK